MALPPPAYRRIYLSLGAGPPGRMALRLSLMPPASDSQMAVLFSKGTLPEGWPVEVDVVVDPSSDLTLKGPKGDKGDKGDASTVAGPKGDTGAASTVPGPKGDTGSKGDTGAPGATLLGTVTIAQTAAIAIAAGVRTVTLALPATLGVVIGGNYLLFPAGALPAGYALHGAIATAANTLQVTMTAPLLAIGASYSIPCRLVRINT